MNINKILLGIIYILFLPQILFNQSESNNVTPNRQFDRTRDLIRNLTHSPGQLNVDSSLIKDFKTLRDLSQQTPLQISQVEKNILTIQMNELFNSYSKAQKGYYDTVAFSQEHYKKSFYW